MIKKETLTEANVSSVQDPTQDGIQKLRRELETDITAAKEE